MVGKEPGPSSGPFAVAAAVPAAVSSRGLPLIFRRWRPLQNSFSSPFVILSLSKDQFRLRCFKGAELILRLRCAPLRRTEVKMGTFAEVSAGTVAATSETASLTKPKQASGNSTQEINDYAVV